MLKKIIIFKAQVSLHFFHIYRKSYVIIVRDTMWQQDEAWNIGDALYHPAPSPTTFGFSFHLVRREEFPLGMQQNYSEISHANFLIEF